MGVSSLNLNKLITKINFKFIAFQNYTWHQELILKLISDFITATSIFKFGRHPTIIQIILIISNGNANIRLYNMSRTLTT